MLSLCVSFLPPPKWEKQLNEYPKKWKYSSVIDYSDDTMQNVPNWNKKHDLVIGFEWNSKMCPKSFHLSLFDLNWQWK